MNRDISKYDNTLAKWLNEDLFPRIKTMEFNEIKKEISDVLDDPEIVMADETRRKYRLQLAQQKSKNQLYMYVGNLTLASSGLGVL